MRLSYDELNKVKEKYGVNTLWSFSKFNSYRTSMYVWFLKYIKHLKPDNEVLSAYAPLGGASHDLLEDLYCGKCNREDMLEEFKESFAANIDIVGLVFDRSKPEQNESIKNKYYDNLVLFFKDYKQLPYKKQSEQFVTIKITDDIVFQGYCDAVWKDEDGNFVVEDYKTSSLYTGAKRDKESAQLVLYSEALRQLGVPRDKIKCCWNFMKYVNIACEQINGKINVRTIERRDVGDKLKASAKTWLKKLGYVDDIETYLKQLVEYNTIDVLPEDVQDKFKIDDCYIYVEDIWGKYETLKQEIINIIEEIEYKTKQYHELKDTDEELAEHLFWDDELSLKSQSYFYNNLCEYKKSTVKPYYEYCKKTKEKKDSNVLMNASSVQPTNNEEYKEDDLSWLDNLL